jgi:uncharacterized membrane protein YccC
MTTQPKAQFTYWTPVKFVLTALATIVIDLAGGAVGLVLAGNTSQTGLWLVALIVVAANLVVAGWLTRKRKYALAAGVLVGLVLAFVSIPTVILPNLRFTIGGAI